MARIPNDASAAGRWVKVEREARGWSQAELAARVTGKALEEGDPTELSQQNLAKFEKGESKRMPAWVRYVPKVFADAAEETVNDPYLSTGKTDNSVSVRFLPTHAGLGQGGTGEGDEGVIVFSRDLIENDLRAPAEALLAMVAEGNSMEPDFKGGDQILVDTRKKSLAQPGAFCLWDGDGHVIKYLEKIPETDPPKVMVVSKNKELYGPRDRLLDDLSIVGRVIWFGRRVQ